MMTSALTKRALGLTLTETGAVALWEVGADVIILGIGSLIWLATGGYSNSGYNFSDITPLVAFGIVATILVGIGAVFVVLRSVRVAPVRHKIREVLTYPGRNRREFAVSLGLTAFYWVMQGVVLAIMLDALGVDPTPLLVLGITSVPILVGMLSPLPGGAGIREALMGGIARIHGAAVSPTIFAAVAYRLALFISIPVLYLLFRVWLSFTKSKAPITEET